jgi:hypothetical protein
LGGQLDRADPLVRTEGLQGRRAHDLEHDQSDRHRCEEQREDAKENDEA